MRKKPLTIRLLTMLTPATIASVAVGTAAMSMVHSTARARSHHRFPDRGDASSSSRVTLRQGRSQSRIRPVTQASLISG